MLLYLVIAFTILPSIILIISSTPRKFEAHALQSSLGERPSCVSKVCNCNDNKNQALEHSASTSSTRFVVVGRMAEAFTDFGHVFSSGDEEEPGCGRPTSSTTTTTTASSSETAKVSTQESLTTAVARIEDNAWPGQHIRSPLARAIYYKIKEDERTMNDRHVYWYSVILSRLSEVLEAKFIQFHQDQGTDDFLESCVEKSNHVFTQFFYSLARPLLNIFMSQTQINGFLNRGSMFIFSTAQFEKLLSISSYHKGNNLLDLGAGDGMITKQMADYFNNVYATEMSSYMVRRLSSHGFKILDVDEWQNVGVTFDLIACLNLLDRCDKPMNLLSQMRLALTPGVGRALVAVVIPFKPYVEFGSRSHEPSELIHIRGDNFEDQVVQFSRIFHQAGFEVETFTRLPYMCEGDLKHSFYVLTDAIFVLKAVES